jgi:hypothetical protein
MTPALVTKFKLPMSVSGLVFVALELQHKLHHETVVPLNSSRASTKE